MRKGERKEGMKEEDREGRDRRRGEWKGRGMIYFEMRR